MAWLKAAMVAYAALVLVGGVMGYVSAKSSMSLITSAIAAAAIVGGVTVTRTNQSLGYGICGAVAFLLAGFFGYRLFSTGSLMPGLPAFILSVLALACLAYAHFTSK